MIKKKSNMSLAWALVFLTIVFLAIALPAWNTSGWTDKQGKLVVNGKEAASDSVSYTANMDLNENAYYMQKGHAYILEHAIELLRNDGYSNWADVARNNLLHLNSGSCHADSYKGRVTLSLELEILWGLASTDLCEWDFTCVGGCEHYYSPGSDKGLNLIGLLQLAEFLQDLSKALSAAAMKPLTFGLLNLHVQLSPDIQQQWPSGIELCQEHYDNAVSTWDNGDLLYPGRASWESSMYELGWACHLLADLTVAQHLQNKFLGSHGGYEDLADGKGDQNGEQTNREPEQNYHAENAKDVYQFSNNRTPTQLAKDLVTGISKLPNHFDKACADDQSAQLEALQGAIPLAEQYTAALIAKFMTDVGVPKKTPPLEGYVILHGGDKLAGAYVFYGLSSVSTIEQNVNIATIDIAKNWQGWAHVRTDANGHYSIPVKPNPLYRYWIRPAMPGYRWEGTTENNLEFGKKESFFTYTARAGMTGSETMNFYLKKIPKSTALVAVPLSPPKTATAMAWNGRMQWAGTRTHIIKPETLLALSATAVSSTLAETVQQSLMKTTSDERVLEVQNGGTKLPEEAFVTVTLSNLMDVYQTKTLSSKSAILATIDQACLARKSVALPTPGLAASTMMNKGKLATAQFISKEQWLAIKAKLPSEQRIGKDNKTRNVYILSANAEGSEGATMLLQNGLVSIPSRGGALIEVSAVSGAGYLTNVKPVTLITNSEGKTAFTVKSGSHAGKIRLQFKVVKNPEAVQILPSDNLEIMVHPPLRGFDPASETAPVLVPAIMDTIAAKKMAPPAPALATFEGQVTLTAPEPEQRQRPERETHRLAEPIPFQPLAPAGPGERRAENFDRDPIRGWEFLGGARPAPAEAGRVLDCRGDGHGVWIIEPVRDFELNFRFRPGSGQGDVFLRMGGEPPQNRQYVVRFLGRDIFLSRRAEGEEKPLGRGKFDFAAGQWYPVMVLAQGQDISISITGRQVLRCTDPMPLPPGNIAFGCRQGEGIAFDDILLAPLEMPGPEGGEPGRPHEPAPGEMEPPRPPEPRPGEIEPPRPPEPKPLEIEPPRPPEPKPREPEPPRPPEPQPQPRPPQQPEQASPPQGPVDLSGSWRSNRGFNFRISQQGNQFTWEVPDIAERGSGTVSGRNVAASWVGRMGSGSAKGTVETAPDGRATSIRWDNGGVFQKQK